MLCFSPKSEPSRASGGIFLVVRGLIWVGSAADWNESSDIAAPYNSIPGQMDKSFERTLSPNPWSSHVMQNSGMSKRFSYTNTLTFTQPRIHSQVSLISCCTAGCGQKQQKGAEASVYLVLLVSWHQGTDVRGHLVRFSHSSAFLTLPRHGRGHFSAGLWDNTFLSFDTFDAFCLFLPLPHMRTMWMSDHSHVNSRETRLRLYLKVAWGWRWWGYNKPALFIAGIGQCLHAAWGSLGFFRFLLGFSWLLVWSSDQRISTVCFCNPSRTDSTDPLLSLQYLVVSLVLTSLCYCYDHC